MMHVAAPRTRADARDPRDPRATLPRGHGALIVPAIVALVSTLLVVGLVQMEVPEDADFPGPRFFPTILAVAGYVLSALLVVHYLRAPDAADRGEHRTYSDWTAFAWIAGGFAAFASLLDLLGWVIGAALLFWCVTRAFRSVRPAYDLGLGLVLSSAVYLVFGAGLGLPLPSGILGGL
ncbi:tripartite tricarboxylate transporter TctB family protein [Nocardioidaceae bacterium]|nr:tripartite tricarboxylate transporter TctB family protein [Nocardioidaceae bacterium]